MKLFGGLLVLLAAPSAAQFDEPPPVQYPKLPAFVRQPADFVPRGWKTVAIKRGDLNGDKRPDVAVLMRMTDPANIRSVESNRYYKQDDTNPYLLAIGFARPNGYTLAVSHHDLFPRETAPMHEDTPPNADTVEIARRVLTLALDHMRGSDQFRFRWDGKAFALVGYDCGGVVGGRFTTLSANYLTQRARIERGDVSSDKSNVSTVRIRPGKRPTLEQSDWEFGWPGTDVRGNSLGC
jgi:signal peptidase I